MQESPSVAISMVPALLTRLKQLHLSSAPSWQPQSGTLLRGPVADPHHILAFCCWQESWKTDSQLLILYMRNPKPREMKGISQDRSTRPRLTDSQASPHSQSCTTPHFWTSLRVFMVFLALLMRIVGNVHLKCPDSVTLQLLVGCYRIWKEVKWTWIVFLLSLSQSGCSQTNEIMYM